MTSALRFEAVHKVYQGAVPVHALSGVSLNVESGAFAVIEGPSGSGKTTLLALAGGLERPTAGRVQAVGVELTALGERRLAAFRRAEVGFVFQDFKLIDVLTALENVAIALQIRGQRRSVARAKSLELLARLGLAGRTSARPATLSGGEKQRVAIARALVTEPALVLADEPTANLDWATGEQVVELLRVVAGERGATVVVVSHDPRLARYADQVMQLVDGRIVAAHAKEAVA
ncbi:MAG: ABC transporter ATP-binding protein [Gemmatimonadota bacterium]|nr:MAG: ABC transporter ATP-binding protein [Gemmatimonadota bacterium]